MPESRSQDVFDRALTRFVTGVPGWVVATVAFLFYPAFGLALPPEVGLRS